MGLNFTPRNASGIRRNNDERVENHGAKDRAGRAVQPHDIQRPNRRERPHQHRRDDREVFRHVIGNAERRQRTARDQQLFSDFDDLDEFRRIGIQVHHVARFLGGLRAGVHRHAHIGLRKRRRVVRAVANHRHHASAALFLSDQRQLVFRLCFGQEIVHARFGGDGRAVSLLSPVIMIVLMPILRSCAKRSLMPPLTTSFR